MKASAFIAAEGILHTAYFKQQRRMLHMMYIPSGEECY
jgi:hypothetical protein